MKHRINNILCI